MSEMLTLTQLERFLNKVQVNDQSHCWEWQGALTKCGYGNVGIRGKNFRAHRLSAAFYNGFDMQSEMLICHHCDNPKCVNPDHLFVGTDKDNSRDMSRKGRAGRKKVTAEQALEIKTLFCTKQQTAKQLSKTYGLNESTIRRLAQGKFHHYLPEMPDPTKEWNYGRKLSEDEVRQLRHEYDVCRIPHRTIAKKYGLNESTVWHIVARNTWKHVS